MHQIVCRVKARAAGTVTTKTVGVIAPLSHMSSRFSLPSSCPSNRQRHRDGLWWSRGGRRWRRHRTGCWPWHCRSPRCMKRRGSVPNAAEPRLPLHRPTCLKRWAVPPSHAFLNLSAMDGRSLHCSQLPIDTHCCSAVLGHLSTNTTPLHRLQAYYVLLNVSVNRSKRIWGPYS